VALAYGRHLTKLMGVTATGSQFLLTSSTRPPVMLPSARTRIALDVFVGRTDAGLAVRSASLAAELWTDPARRLRGGVGLELGVVGYVRATDGSLSGLLTAGARAAVEVAAVRLRWGEVIAGGEAAARVGPWTSAGLFAGLRLGRPPAHAAR
jgi:hypothetical protein